MATVTFNLYDTFRVKSFDGAAVDFEAVNTLKMAVLTAGYIPNQATDSLFSGISANEVSGTGYTPGGEVCSNGIVSLATGTVTVDANDPAVWSQDAGGFSNGRSVALYDIVSGDLIGYSADFGADQGNLNGDFSVAFGVDGIFTSAR